MGKVEFNSAIVIIPGLGNSGERHWQTRWEQKYGFSRIQQDDWNQPDKNEWIGSLNKQLEAIEDKEVILVAHSLACVTTALWASEFSPKIKAALLVAPADTEAKQNPDVIKSFTPIPLQKLPFKSIVVASTNDQYVSLERANFLADAWGSEFINIGESGHINSDSNLGDWELGIELLKELDRY